MSEDVPVKKEDIEEVEKEVLDKAKAREDEIKSNIEAKLRKEMEDDKKAKEEADELAKLKAENEAMQKMLKEKEEQKEIEIIKLKEQIGTSKAIHNQPLSQEPTKLDLSDSNMRDIDEDSKKAFLGKYGLTEAQWKGR